MRFLHLAAAAALASLAALSGCAAFQKVMSNPASPTVIQAAVDVAVGTAVPALAKNGRTEAQVAAQIVSVAKILEGLDTGDTATLQALQSALDAKVASAGLNPDDLMAANLLVSTLTGILEQEIQTGITAATGPLAPIAQVAIKAVLDDVVQAAGTYQAQVKAKLARKLPAATL